MTVTFIGRSRSSSVPGATTTRPSGLSRSLAILATSFDEPMPTDAVSPPVTSCRVAQSSAAPRHARPSRSSGGRRRPGRRTPRRARAARPAATDSRSTSITCCSSRGRHRSGRSGTPRAGTAPGPHGSTSPSGRRTRGPRTTPWRPRRGPRCRRRRPACRAATACRAARRQAKKASRSTCRIVASLRIGRYQEDRRPYFVHHRSRRPPGSTGRDAGRDCPSRHPGRGGRPCGQRHPMTPATARGPADLPRGSSRACLGFLPEQSLVLLTVGAPGTASMPASTCRPRRDDDVAELIEVLLAPAAQRVATWRCRLRRRRTVAGRRRHVAVTRVRRRGHRRASTCCAPTTDAGAACRRGRRP